MNNMIKAKGFLAAGVMALAAMAALPTTANAVSFTGQIDYTGAHISDNADLSLATQTSIIFANVTVNLGSFSVMPLGTPLTHTTPLVWSPPGTPYTPLWVDPVSGIAFDLTSLAIDFASATSLVLSGSGMFRCASAPCAYDDTPGSWNLTLNNAGATLGSFSSSSTVPAPEPGTLALLGLGLMGLGVARRRRAV